MTGPAAQTQALPVHARPLATVQLTGRPVEAAGARLAAWAVPRGRTRAHCECIAHAMPRTHALGMVEWGKGWDRGLGMGQGVGMEI